MMDREKLYRKALDDIAALGLRPVQHFNSVELERNQAVAIALRALAHPETAKEMVGD